MSATQVVAEQLKSIVFGSIAKTTSTDVDDIAMSQGDWPLDAEYCVTVRYFPLDKRNLIEFFPSRALMEEFVASIEGSMSWDYVLTIYEWDLGPQRM